MKKNILIILIAFTLNSCRAQNAFVEEGLYNCFANSLTTEELNKFEKLLAEYEKYLIGKQILKSNSAESYFKIYKDISDNKSFDFENDFDFNSKLIKAKDRNNRDSFRKIKECTDSIYDTNEFAKSSRYKIEKEMELLDKNDIDNPIIIAEKIVKYMNVDEFDFAYNRMNTLLFIEKYKNYRK